MPWSNLYETQSVKSTMQTEAQHQHSLPCCNLEVVKKHEQTSSSRESKQQNSAQEGLSIYLEEAYVKKIYCMHVLSTTVFYEL